MRERHYYNLSLYFVVVFIVGLILAMSGIIPARAWSGYDYYRILTIESDDIDATLTNLPVKVSFTNTTNKTVANGGHIENTTTGGASGSLTIPADLVFCNDIDCSVQYDHEIENYDATTGELTAWFKVPSVSDTTDTDIYMHYGASSVTTNQENISGVWSEDYAAVYHFESAGVYDSTSNGNDATDNASASGTTGLIGDGVEFDADDYYTTPDDSTLDMGTSDFSLIMAFDVSGDGGAAFSYGDRSDNEGITCYLNLDGSKCLLDDSSTQISVEDATDYTDGTFHVFVFSADRDGNGSIYIDGVNEVNTDISTVGDLTGTDVGYFDLGRVHWAGTYPGSNYLGYGANVNIDEVRIIKGDFRSAAWAAAISENMKNKSGWLTINPETSPPATATPSPTVNYTATPAVTMGQASIPVTPGMENAVATALATARPDATQAPPHAEVWAVMNWTESDTTDYYWFSLIGADMEGTPTPDDWTYNDKVWTGMALVEDLGAGSFDAAIEGTGDYEIMLDAAGLADIAYQGEGGTGSSNYFFPWPSGYTAYYGTLGIHGSGSNAVDFFGGPIGFRSDVFPNAVYVSASGAAYDVCRDDYQTAVSVGPFRYLHLVDNNTLREGVWHGQGTYLAALVTGDIPNSAPCGYADQHPTAYHLHWVMLDATPGGLYRVEGWVLDLSTGTFSQGDETVNPGQYLPAEWGSRPVIPTQGPTVTPGGPTVTPGGPISWQPEDAGGGEFWDNILSGVSSLVETRTSELAAMSEPYDDIRPSIGVLMLSGVRIATRSAYVIISSHLNMTVTIAVLMLILMLEPVRVIMAIWLGIKKLIPFF